MLGSTGGVLWGFWTRARVVDSNYKVGFSRMVFPKVLIRHTGTGRQGKMLIARVVGKPYWELAFGCDSGAAI